MLVAGRDDWSIWLNKPQVLDVALYIRDIERLQPVIDPELPPVDPPTSPWPLWARRPPAPVASRPVVIDRAAASEQWAQWWRFLLSDRSSILKRLHPPRFRMFAHAPDLRALLVRHHLEALAWSEGIDDDPRVARDMVSPWLALTDLVTELERVGHRRARAFSLQITLVPLAGRRAWVLSREHLMITRHLLEDQDNLLDWIERPVRDLV